MSTPRQKLEPKHQRVSILHDPDVAGHAEWWRHAGATSGSGKHTRQEEPHVIVTVAKALGHDVSSVILSRSSIRLSRCRNREKQATVEQEFIHSQYSSSSLGWKASS